MRRREFLKLAGMTVVGAGAISADTLPAVVPQQEIVTEPSGLWYFTATYQPYHEWVEERFSMWANILEGRNDNWRKHKNDKNFFGQRNQIIVVSFELNPEWTFMRKQYFQNLLDAIKQLPPKPYISHVTLEKITPVQTIVDDGGWFPLTESGERQTCEVQCGPVRYTLTLRGTASGGLSGADWMDFSTSHTRCPMIHIEQERINTLCCYQRNN